MTVALRVASLWIGAIASIAVIRVADARVFTVNSTADLVDIAPGNGACRTSAGTCTLRAAIQEANAWPGPDQITLATGVYALTINGIGENASATGDLDTTSVITIIGSGPLQTIIDASALVPRDRVIHVLAGSLTLQQLQLRGGDGQIFGGGLFDQNAGVTLHEVRVQDNRALNDGGGIRATGSQASLTVSNSTIVRNTAPMGGGIALDNGAAMSMNDSVVRRNTAAVTGGGIYLNRGADAILMRCTIDGNGANQGGWVANLGSTFNAQHSSITGNESGIGGGIMNIDGDVIASDTTIDGNTAGTGGGVYHDAATGAASLALHGVTLTNNTATAPDGGGGVFAHHGSVAIEGSTINSNSATSGPGGGLVLDSDDAAMVIDSSTLSRNAAATNGGGIACPGDGNAIAVTRSTIDHNLASGDGGGIWGAALAATTILKSTISSNTGTRGGGVYVRAQTATSVLSLLHSTIAFNIASTASGAFIDATSTLVAYHAILAPGIGGSCGGPGTLSSNGYNVIEATAGCSLISAPTDQLNVSAGLQGLASNGGPTQTHAITILSRAFNAGDPTDCATGGPTDQRGDAMPVGLACDVGAYELQ